MKSEAERAKVFSKVLRQRISELQIDQATFMFGMRMRQIGRVISWLNGTALPPASRVGDLALVLDMCPAELLLIWMGEIAPESSS